VTQWVYFKIFEESGVLQASPEISMKPAVNFTGVLSALKAIEGRSHLPRSQESGLGAEKRLAGTARVDTIIGQ
jgi:hypothetical protein